MASLLRGCRNIVVFFVLLAVVAAAGGVYVWQRYQGFANQPIAGLQAGDAVMVESGDSFARVLHKLREQGVDEGSDAEWRLLARKYDVAAKLQVGEYALRRGMTPLDLLRDMRDGKVVQHRITFVEGWNIRQVRAALAKETPLLQETAKLDDAALMKTLGHAGQHPEGRFLPETYVYTRGDSDLDVLQRAYAAMEKALADAWGKRAADVPLQSPYEALILASIVEKETAAPQERPQIAGVFSRRLKLGMRLQTDPTVIYGIANYDGNIRKRDLLTDTPYNTYTRAGLPPTPIAMPSREALQAAVNPADGDELYFVAMGDGSGRHYFSASIAEHNAAVARYLQQLRRQRAMQAAKAPQ